MNDYKFELGILEDVREIQDKIRKVRLLDSSKADEFSLRLDKINQILIMKEQEDGGLKLDFGPTQVLSQIVSLNFELDFFMVNEGKSIEESNQLRDLQKDIEKIIEKGKTNPNSLIQSLENVKKRWENVGLSPYKKLKFEQAMASSLISIMEWVLKSGESVDFSCVDRITTRQAFVDSMKEKFSLRAENGTNNYEILELINEINEENFNDVKFWKFLLPNHDIESQILHSKGELSKVGISRSHQQFEFHGPECIEPITELPAVTQKTSRITMFFRNLFKKNNRDVFLDKYDKCDSKFYYGILNSETGKYQLKYIVHEDTDEIGKRGREIQMQFNGCELIGIELFSPENSYKKYIPDNAFIVDVLPNLERKIEFLIIGDGIRGIERNGLCRLNVKTLYLTGKDLRDIADNACSSGNFDTVVMNDDITKLGRETFFMCRYLKNVRLSKALIDIPESCFAYCESLEHIELPENLLVISSCAFEASGLKSISVPPNVREIENGAFAKCKSLEKMDFLGASIVLEKLVFPVSSESDVSLVINCKGKIGRTISKYVKKYGRKYEDVVITGVQLDSEKNSQSLIGQDSEVVPEQNKLEGNHNEGQEHFDD